MIIGQVVDELVSTCKHSALVGQKLLLVQPIDLQGSESGEPVLAIDGVDAGVGDRVLLTQEGFSAMHVLGEFYTPVDAAILGVVDSVHISPPADGIIPPQSSGKQ